MEDDWREAEMILIIIKKHLLAGNGSRAGRVVDLPRDAPLDVQSCNEVIPIRSNGISNSSEC